MSDESPLPASPVIDAYMHVGSQRFGTARQALGTMDRWGTDAAVLVLGPRVPDIAALIEAQRARPGRIRAVGIPYGDTPEGRLACAEACLTAGAIGIRMQGDEPLENPAVMDLLGGDGRWIYATDPLASPRHTALYLEWLARYPQARLAAPHFLRPSLAPLDEPLAEQLVRHPRFYAILSRQGQMGSREPYPFRDLRPWVERLLHWCGPDRMLWGSEYPVIYWRGEQIDQTRRWLRDVRIDWSAQALAAVSGGNARRLFFESTAPEAQESLLADWLRDYPPPGPVPLSPSAPLQLPIDVYRPLFDAYSERNSPEAPLSFADYVIERLRASTPSGDSQPPTGDES